MATTQDKALQRISKLKTEKRELLERLKEVEEHKNPIKSVRTIKIYFLLLIVIDLGRKL